MDRNVKLRLVNYLLKGSVHHTTLENEFGASIRKKINHLKNIGLINKGEDQLWDMNKGIRLVLNFIQLNKVANEEEIVQHLKKYDYSVECFKKYIPVLIKEGLLRKDDDEYLLPVIYERKSMRTKTRKESTLIYNVLLNSGKELTYRQINSAINQHYSMSKDTLYRRLRDLHNSGKVLYKNVHRTRVYSATSLPKEDIVIETNKREVLIKDIVTSICNLVEFLYPSKNPT